MTTTEAALKAKISAFAVWADKAILGWRGKVNTSRLSMLCGMYVPAHSNCGCVGAQLSAILDGKDPGYYEDFQHRHKLSDEQCVEFCLCETTWESAVSPYRKEWNDGTVDRLWIEEISRDPVHGQD